MSLLFKTRRIFYTTVCLISLAVASTATAQNPWQPQPAKASLMVIHAHPDDEGIFFGGTIPYYAQVRQLPSIDILMTQGAAGQNHRTQASDSANVMVNQDGETLYLREAEQYNAARVYGLNNKPILGGFADGGSDGWRDLSNPRTSPAVAFVVEQIRTYRPDVLVTHALDGEFTRHADHLATANVVNEAYDLVADATYRPDLGAIWQIKKLYMYANISNKQPQNETLEHSWEERFGVLDLNNSTIGFNGDLGFFTNTDVIEDGSSRDIANQGLRQHASQSGGFWTLLDSNPGNDVSPSYTRVESIHESEDRNNGPSEFWRLYKSSVGADSRARNDFFENIDLRPYDAAVIGQFSFKGGDGSSVNADGGNVISYWGGYAAAKTQTGDGGQFSSDIPTQRVQNAWGTRSLNLAAGSLSTGGAGEGGFTTFGDIRANEGLTLEAWIKGNGDGTGIDKVLSVAGAFNLQVNEGVLTTENGFTSDAAQTLVDLSEWTHVVAVFRLSENDTGSGALLADLELYVDGVLADTFKDSLFSSDLDRGLGIGQHPTTNGERYGGLIYEPTVSLSALDGTSFVTLAPEPGSLALLGAGALLLMRRRRTA